MRIDPNNVDGPVIVSLFAALHHSIDKIREDVKDQIASSSRVTDARIEEIEETQLEDSDRMLDIAKKSRNHKEKR